MHLGTFWGHLRRLVSNGTHIATVGLAVDHEVRLRGAVARSEEFEEVPESLCMANPK